MPYSAGRGEKTIPEEEPIHACAPAGLGPVIVGNGLRAVPALCPIAYNPNRKLLKPATSPKSIIAYPSR